MPIVSIFLIAILGLSGAVATAQTKEFSDKFLHVKAGIAIPGYSLKFKAKDADVEYLPNTKALFFLGFAVQDYFGFSWGFPLKQDSEERVQKGETDYQDYRFNYAFRSFMVGLSYSKYKGFYVKDSAKVDTTWTPGSPFYNQPDLFSENMGASFSYVLHPERFSLISAIEQTARQRNSGGSFLVGSAISQTTFHNSAEIIPVDVRAQYGADQNIQEGRFRALNLVAGYGHMFVLSEKWFASGILQLGLGSQVWKIKGPNLSSSGRRGAGVIDGILSTGYSGDDYFGGFSTAISSRTYKANSIEISSTLAEAKLFAGMRF